VLLVVMADHRRDEGEEGKRGHQLGADDRMKKHGRAVSTLSTSVAQPSDIVQQASLGDHLGLLCANADLERQAAAELPDPPGVAELDGLGPLKRSDKSHQNLPDRPPMNLLVVPAQA
jgi:hypothetical protein